MTALRYAIIGLGRMGGQMADHAVRAGHDVVVHDIDMNAVAARVELGATAAHPAAAAEGADVVSIVVFDDAQVREVLLGGADGQGGMLAALPRDAVVTIHTTVNITTIHELARLASDYGVQVLDAGISGGEEGAKQGTLVTMVGGDSTAVERARPALMSFSKEVLHAGPLGSGMALKLARNAAGYVMMAAAHEAMELAFRNGIDPAVLKHTIEATGVLQQAMAPFMLGGPEPIDATTNSGLVAILEHTAKLADKDLGQALELAQRSDAATPIIAATHASFHRVVRLSESGNDA